MAGPPGRHGAGDLPAGQQLGKSYTLLTATSGLTGTFGTLSTQNLPGFLSASLGYSLTNVILNLQSSMASTPGLGGNQISVARALDTAFNAGPGLGAMPALFGLSQGQMPYALTVLSGRQRQRRTVVQPCGGRPVRRAHGKSDPDAARRRTDRRNSPPAAATRRQPASRRPTGAPGAQALAARSGSTPRPRAAHPPRSRRSAAAPSAATIAPIRRRCSARPSASAARIIWWMRPAPADRQPARTSALYGLYDAQTFYVNAALAYSRFDGNATRFIAGIGSDETAKSSGRLEPARRKDRTRPSVRAGQGRRRSIRRSRRSSPSSRPSSGRRQSPRRASPKAAVPGVFALNYQSQATTSLPTFLGAQLDAETDARLRGPSRPGSAPPGCMNSWPTAASRRASPVLPGSDFHRRRRARRQQRRPPRPRRQVCRRQPDLAVRQRQCRTVRPRAEPRRHRWPAHRLVELARTSSIAIGRAI